MGWNPTCLQQQSGRSFSPISAANPTDDWQQPGQRHSEEQPGQEIKDRLTHSGGSAIPHYVLQSEAVSALEPRLGESDHLQLV